MRFNMCGTYLPSMTLFNSHQELDAQVCNDGWKWCTGLLCVVSLCYKSETEMEVNDAKPASLTCFCAAQPSFCVTLTRRRSSDSSAFASQLQTAHYLKNWQSYIHFYDYNSQLAVKLNGLMVC